jgi:hypothetical protein
VPVPQRRPPQTAAAPLAKGDGHADQYSTLNNSFVISDKNTRGGKYANNKITVISEV